MMHCGMLFNMPYRVACTSSFICIVCAAQNHVHNVYHFQSPASYAPLCLAPFVISMFPDKRAGKEMFKHEASYVPKDGRAGIFTKEH